MTSGNVSYVSRGTALGAFPQDSGAPSCVLTMVRKHYTFHYIFCGLSPPSQPFFKPPCCLLKYLDINDIPSIFELGRWIFSAEVQHVQVNKEKVISGQLDARHNITGLDTEPEKKLALKDIVVTVGEAGIWSNTSLFSAL